MKKCPACQSTYSDDTLIYCLQDGVPLEDEEREQETVIRPQTPEAVTVAIGSGRETDEVTQEANARAVAASTGGPRTIVAVLLTIFAMLVLFGVIGVSAFLYFGRGEPAETAAVNSRNEKSNINGIDRSAMNSEVPASPDPETNDKPSTRTPVPAATATPAPDGTPDAGEIKTRVEGLVYQWASLAKSRNLGTYMSIYGDRIDYYRKNGASKSFVRADKNKAFTKYDKISISLSNMAVTPSDDGKTASAVFDKEFRFSNETDETSGKVRSKLIFRQIGGQWKIVSERDLKVYYVNK